MIKQGIALRYSKALFNLDNKNEVLEKRLNYCKLLVDALKINPKAMKFFQSPQIGLNEKKKVLNEGLKGITDTDFIQFIMQLIEANRIDYLGQITDEFRILVDHFLNYWEAKIITAIPLEAHTEEKLSHKLEKYYHKKMKIQNEVNPNIIGGAILIANNEMIDWSIATRLNKLREDLMKTTV